MLDKSDARPPVRLHGLGQPQDHAGGGHAVGGRLQARPQVEPRRRARNAGAHDGRGVALDREVEGRLALAPVRRGRVPGHRRAARPLGRDRGASRFVAGRACGRRRWRRRLRYRNLQGQEFEAPLWQLVQHVANHSTYHRGQVVTLLRQLGAKAVATDLVAWDRERAAKRASAPRGRSGRPSRPSSRRAPSRSRARRPARRRGRR